MHRPPPPSHIPQPRLTPPSPAPIQLAEPNSREFRTSWKGPSRDLVITFLGVLLALGVNEWWQGRQDRARERVELEQILATTRESESRLARAITQDSFAQALAQHTAERFASADAAPPLDSLRSWLPRSFVLSEWHPQTGAYGALLFGSDLRLIRNARLRRHIATYAGDVETTSGTLGRMEPLALQSRTQMDRLLSADRSDAARTSGQSALAEEKGLAAALRGNQEVRQLLHGEGTIAATRVTLLKALRSEATALRQALESELGVTSVASQASDTFKL